MLHNWEFAPPLPDHGEDSPDPLFFGVGKVMSGWEMIEFELSRLYSVFAGDPDGAAMRDYGKHTVAHFRLSNLSEMADRYFIKRPCQGCEGKLLSILAKLRNFASRRNEVAHGIVFDVQKIVAFTENFVPAARGRPQFLLIAPFYQLKQHAPDGLPAYGYTSQTLQAMIPAMLDSFGEVHEFRVDLLATDKPKEGPPKPFASTNKKQHRSRPEGTTQRQQPPKR